MSEELKPVQTFQTLPRERQLAILGQSEWELRMNITEESPMPDVIVLNGVRYTPETKPPAQAQASADSSTRR